MATHSTKSSAEAQQQQQPPPHTIYGAVVFGLPATIKYSDLLALANLGAPGVEDIEIEVDDTESTTCTIEYNNEHSLRQAVARLHNRIHEGVVLSCYTNVHLRSEVRDLQTIVEQDDTMYEDQPRANKAAIAAQALAAEGRSSQSHRYDTIDSMHDYARSAFGEHGFCLIVRAVSDGFKRDGIQRYATREQYIALWDEAINWMFQAGLISYSFQDDAMEIDKDEGGDIKEDA